MKRVAAIPECLEVPVGSSSTVEMLPTDSGAYVLINWSRDDSSHHGVLALSESAVSDGAVTYLGLFYGGAALVFSSFVLPVAVAGVQRFVGDVYSRSSERTARRTIEAQRLAKLLRSGGSDDDLLKAASNAKLLAYELPRRRLRLRRRLLRLCERAEREPRSKAAQSARSSLANALQSV